MGSKRTRLQETLEDPVSSDSSKAKLRWFPGLLVLLLAVFLSFFEQYFLPVHLPSVGRPSPQPIRAPYDFLFDEDAHIKRVIEQELQEFIPFYEYDADESRRILERLDSFFEQARQCKEEAQAGGQKAEKCLRDSQDVPLPGPGIAELLRYPHIEKLQSLLRTIVANVIETGIYAPEEIQGGTAFVRVQDPVTGKTVKKAVADLLSLDQAQGTIKDKLDLLKIDPVLRDLLAQKAKALLTPNLHYSLENEEKLAAIRTRESSGGRVLYRRGDLLVPRGKTVDLLDFYRVEACLSRERPDLLLVGMGSFIPFFVLTFLFLLSLQRVPLPVYANSSRPYLLIFFLILAVLAIAKAAYLLTNLTGYAMPVSAVGVVLALLLNLPVALLAVSLTSVYATFLTHLDMGLFVYYLIGGIFLTLCTRRNSRRTVLFFWSILGGALQVLLLACLLLLTEEEPSRTALLHLGPQAFLASPAAWMIAVLFLPLCERVFGLASADRLRELADLNHPLLKRLLEKAPGTYYHSLSVANLACAAAEAIQADVILTRVGAYYHDIGKMMQPEYFIENQNGRNPHDTLEPTASYEIVKAHTRDGVDLATQYRFPIPVLDLIAEHHGTTVMEVFYNKAQQSFPEALCSRDFFRYDGPKPGRPESAILMIADVVEAVARVNKAEHPGRVREMVHKVIVTKFEDGQFERCGLDTAVLATIEAAITQALLGYLHKRIEYPEDREAAGNALLA